jgi:hypothetical protein
MPGLQTRHSEDTSSDDDSDYDKKPTKASTTKQWKVPINDSDGEKFTCRCVREQRTKRNAKRLHNRRQKASLRKERIKNTQFAEDADEPFVPFLENAIIDKEPDTIEDNKVKFFPTYPHPFRTGTIIKENGFLFKERQMDGLIFYDSLEVLNDPDKTLDIIKDSDQYWTTCSKLILQTRFFQIHLLSTVVRKVHIYLLEKNQNSTMLTNQRIVHLLIS